MAYSEDPAILVTGSYDHTLRFWDAFQEDNTKPIEYGTEHIVNRIEIAPDKIQMGAACTYSIRLYDICRENNQEKTIYDGFSNNVTALGFQKDSKWIYASSEDGSVRICDHRAPGFQRTYPNKEAMNCLALHPNEVNLVYICLLHYKGRPFCWGSTRIFDLVADKMRNKHLPLMLESGKSSAEHYYKARSLSIGLDGKHLVAADSAGYCHSWKLKSGEEISTPVWKFHAHEDYILKCLISPDASMLATCSADKTIKIWNFSEEKGYELNKDLYGHHKWVWDCAFSCDSQLLVTCSTDCVAKIWNIENGEVIRNFTGHTKGINCLALNDLPMRSVSI